jgi:diaminohydroxyphosphoribosylaminopyrimidine deaminase/5-amino-6-(5-phosphoribosylamino)uracil reductase
MVADSSSDAQEMSGALELGMSVRATTSPNPWVGCVVRTTEGERFLGATAPPGGPHAEAVALARAGAHARGATVYVTLEPCAHFGRTPPCADALIAAGVARVVIGIADPDPKVNGTGADRLRAAGVEVVILDDPAVKESLLPYLTHRSTGRPWVVLKLASSLDGKIAGPSGDSVWITGPEARRDVHRLRTESDAILVGAGTVRADNPRLDVREVEGRDPLRIVLGTIPEGAKVLPALERSGPLEPILDELGARGVLQLLVEGGAQVASTFHHAGLVDQYLIYLAPAIFGGDDAKSMFAGQGVQEMDKLWRGKIVSVQPFGDDLRLDIRPQ